MSAAPCQTKLMPNVNHRRQIPEIDQSPERGIDCHTAKAGRPRPALLVD